MASTRMIREGFLDSEKVSALSWRAECFFHRLLLVADDHGLFDARIPVLRTRLFPLHLDKVREADLQRDLAECEGAGLVRLYCVQGKPYLQILHYGQRTQSKPKFPLPPAPVHGGSRNGTVNDGESRGFTDKTESETETYAETEQEKTSPHHNPVNSYSGRSRVDGWNGSERLNPYPESEEKGFARFLAAVCSLRPGWAKVLPNGVETGIARELYDQVKGTLTPRDLDMLKAYFADGRTREDKHGNRFFRPDSRKMFLEGFAGFMEASERWAKETRWKPRKAKAGHEATPPPEPEETPLSPEETMLIFRKMKNEI